MKPLTLVGELLGAFLVAALFFLASTFNSETPNFDLVVPEEIYAASAFTDLNSSISFTPTIWDCSSDSIVTFFFKQKAKTNPLLTDWNVNVDLVRGSLMFNPDTLRKGSVGTSIDFVSNETGCKKLQTGNGCGGACDCPTPQSCWEQKGKCIWSDKDCKSIVTGCAGELRMNFSMAISGSALNQTASMLSVSTLFNGLVKRTMLDVTRKGTDCDSNLAPPTGSSFKPSSDDAKKKISMKSVTIEIEINIPFEYLETSSGDNYLSLAAAIDAIVRKLIVLPGSSFRPKGQGKSLQVTNIEATDATFDASEVGANTPVNVSNATFCGSNATLNSNNQTTFGGANLGCDSSSSTPMTANVNGGTFQSLTINVEVKIKITGRPVFKKMHAKKKVKITITETITIGDLSGSGDGAMENSFDAGTTFTIAIKSVITISISFLRPSSKYLTAAAGDASGVVGCGTTFTAVNIGAGVVADFGTCTAAQTTAASATLLGTMQFSGIDGTLTILPFAIYGPLTTSGTTPVIAAACAASWTSWGGLSQIKLATYGSTCVSIIPSVSGCPSGSILTQAQEGSTCVVYLKLSPTVSQASTATAAAVASPSPSPAVVSASTSSTNSSEKGLYGLFALLALPLFLGICLLWICRDHFSGQQATWGQADGEGKDIPGVSTPSNTPHYP